MGFRWSAQEEARSLGLAGWIRNEDDGSVSGLVQGESPAVEKFAAWLGRGTRSARVDRVDLTDAPASGLRNFSVR